eukprot:787803-Amphidinium_carterae.1
MDILLLLLTEAKHRLQKASRGETLEVSLELVHVVNRENIMPYKSDCQRSSEPPDNGGCCAARC